MLTFWFLLQESATRRLTVHHHQCDEEAGEVPAASSPVLSSLRGIPSFSSLPSLSSLHGLVLSLPALHSWQSLPTVSGPKMLALWTVVLLNSLLISSQGLGIPFSLARADMNGKCM